MSIRGLIRWHHLLMGHRGFQKGESIMEGHVSLSKGHISSKSAKSSSPMLGWPKQASNHHQQVQCPRARVWCHEGKGSTTSPKRCTIIVNAHIINPKLKSWKGTMSKALSAMSQFISPTSKVKRCWKVFRGRPSDQGTQRSSSSLQCPLYNAQCPMHKHEDVLWRRPC
jgi:hypothetical protein